MTEFRKYYKVRSNIYILIKNITWNIHQFLYHLLNKYYKKTKHNLRFENNPRVDIEEKVIDHIFERIKSGDIHTGTQIYSLLKIGKVSLTGAMRKQEISDSIVRGILNIADDATIEGHSNDILQSIENVLGSLGIAITQKDRKYTFGRRRDHKPERMKKNERKILKEAESANIAEHMLELESLENINKKLALITIILVNLKKINWDDLSNEVKLQILKQFKPNDSYYFQHTENSRGSSTVRVPEIFTTDSKIARTIVENQELWDIYIKIRKASKQYLISHLICYWKEAKEKAKQENEFEKLVQAKNYQAIWRIIVTDSHHTDFEDSNDDSFQGIQADEIHWDNVPKHYQKHLLMDIDFLKAGQKYIGRGLGALLKNIEDEIISNENIWNIFLKMISSCILYFIHLLKQELK